MDAWRFFLTISSAKFERESSRRGEWKEVSRPLRSLEVSGEPGDDCNTTTSAETKSACEMCGQIGIRRPPAQQHQHRTHVNTCKHHPGILSGRHHSGTAQLYKEHTSGQSLTVQLVRVAGWFPEQRIKFGSVSRATAIGPKGVCEPTLFVNLHQLLSYSPDHNIRPNDILPR